MISNSASGPKAAAARALNASTLRLAAPYKLFVNRYIDNAVQWQLLVLEWLENAGVRYYNSSNAIRTSTALAAFQRHT
jgi:hypothetical protein